MASFPLQYLTECWKLLCQMSPALLAGFLAAGVIAAFLPPEFIRRHLGGGGLKSIAKAALLGVPMPLCSCGVLPVAAALKRSGASTGAIVAFLISVPQTGADNILVVWSLLGPVFAAYSPFAAFLSGIFGGAVCERLGSKSGKGDAKIETAPAAEATPKTIQAILRHSYVATVDDIAGALAIGILIAAGISMLVPDGWIAAHVGPGLGAMALMLTLGIPLYVCSTGSVPIAAAFIAKGASPGAALVFLVTGPASNAAGLAAISRMLGARTAALYLASLATFAFASGAILNLFAEAFPGGFSSAGHSHGAESAESLTGMLAGAAMLCLMAASLARRVSAQVKLRRARRMEAGAVRLEIGGMTCANCAKAVEEALLKLPGAESASVDLKGGMAIIKLSDPSKPFPFEAAKAAVEELGYACKPSHAA